MSSTNLNPLPRVPNTIGAIKVGSGVFYGQHMIRNRILAMTLLLTFFLTNSVRHC